MISYKVKGIILAVIISLASIMMPFSVYADSISLSNINGVSVTLDEITFIENVQYTVSGGTLTVQRNFFTYQAEIQFDKSYLGYVDISYKYYFTGRNDTGLVNYNQTKNQKVFVNGDKAYFTFSFIANSSVDPLNYTSSLLTLNSSDLIEYGLLSDINQIIEILQDNQDIINDILSELQTVVSNTSLANDYLEAIYKMKQWEIPFESLSIVSFYLTQSNFSLYDGYLDNSYVMNYPMFYIPKYKLAFSTYLNSGDSCLIIFASEIKRSDLLTYFNNLNLSGFTYDIQTSNIGRGVNDYLTLYKIKVTNNSNNQNFGVYTTGSFDTSKYIIPILCVNLPFNNISTDFALRFGLSNPLLDNIQTIANGTNQSNQSASDLESEASEYSEIADDVIEVEEGLTSNFETNVNQIDLSSGLNVFGGNFMTSATWVRTQFDRLTENTPYGSLVVYGLTLGFALLMLGKVFL